MTGVPRGMWVVLLVGVVGAGWGLWQLYQEPNRADLSAYWQLVVAVAAIAVAVIPLARDLRRHRTADDDTSELDRLADQLADAVSQQWTQAATARHLLQPEPIAVRWALPADPVAGSAAAATASTRFPPIPGFTAIRQVLRQGGLRDLHTMYGGLGSGRMMIVGAPGSGKTGAAVLLVLAALRHRDTVPDADRARVPVPVLLTPHGWNPRTEPVRDWLVVALRQTYEGLFTGKRGARAAARLLDEGRVAVVVDGLDEMTEQLQPLALQALSEQATFRLVVLGRTAESAEAAEQAMLDEAFAVELQGVDATTAADYLTRVQLDPPPDRWRELTDLLRTSPNSPLARTLRVPLTLTLVRDTYRSGDSIGELLDFCAAHGDIPRDDIEDHLLDRVLPQAYARRPGQPPPRYTFSSAQRTLELIAARMSQDQTRDLAWWRIPGWTSRLLRVVAIGLASGTVVGVGLNLLFRLPLPAWAVTSLTLVAGIGGMFGAWLGGRTQAHIEPARWQFIFSHPAFVFVLGAGIGYLLVWNVAIWLGRLNYIGPLVALMTLLPVGFTIWIVVWVATWLAMKGGYRTAYLRWRSVHRRPFVAFTLGFGCSLVYILWSSLIPGEFGLRLGVGLAGLLVLGLGLWGVLGRPRRPVGPLAPFASWAQHRAAALAVWLGLGLIAGGLAPRTSVFWDLFGIVPTGNLVLAAFLGIGLLSGFVLGLICPETWSTSLACAQLTARRRTPIRLMRFLDDAHERNVLRTVGPVYQFRHARLQDRLARAATPAAPGESDSDQELEDQVDELAGDR